MEEGQKNQSERRYYLFALRIVGDFGASIAVPVVLCALLGKYIDGKVGHAPLFTILGFVLAALISGKIIYTKAKKYGKEYQQLK